MSIASGDAKDADGVSAWNAPYGSLSSVGLRGSMASMHVAGDSLKTKVWKS